MTTESESFNRLRVLKTVLDGLMRRYRNRVPDVAAVIKVMLTEGLISGEEEIENDHIAFRTMGVPHLGLASLEKLFLHYGYLPMDRYDFPEKKVTARWYQPPLARYPRIFISELQVGQLSADAQRLIHSYTGTVQADPVNCLDLDDGSAVDAFLHQPLWRTPTYADYQRLSDESEFAAWVIYNRYYLNHFTVTIHNLPPDYNTIPAFNTFLERHDFRLNDAGGKIKVSSDGMLVQSSTVAEIVEAMFDDGRGGLEPHLISGSYVEFAERQPLTEHVFSERGTVLREHRRDGFDAGNANKIFESTYSNQTSKRSAGSGRNEQGENQ